MRAPQAILVVFENEPAAIKLAPLIRTVRSQFPIGNRRRLPRSQDGRVRLSVSTKLVRAGLSRGGPHSRAGRTSHRKGSHNERGGRNPWLAGGIVRERRFVLQEQSHFNRHEERYEGNLDEEFLARCEEDL